jgi:hypothetical protein
LDGTEFYFTFSDVWSKINEKEVLFMEDTEKTLERLEQELIKEEPDQLDALLEEFLNEPLPAFEEPDTTVVAAEPEEYRNFSNDYGQTLPKEEKPCVDEDRQRAKRENDERTVVALMAVASVECLGILAILAYWLKMFL